MKIGYADPPYPGQAKRHYSNDPSGIPAAEVDHAELIERLLRDYDGFALSSSTPAIPMISVLIHGDDPYKDLHPEVRTAAWVKPFCSWKPTHRVQYTWEPVFFKPVRVKGSRAVPSVRDYVSCRITTRKGTHGAKPQEFCEWVWQLIGAVPGDELVDLYPGSGAMREAAVKMGLMVDA